MSDQEQLRMSNNDGKLFEVKVFGLKSITPGTGKSFLQFKLILSILFAICLAHEFLYTYFTVKFFKDQINEGTTRSGIQVLRTHAHFFTLSGIWSGVCILVGLWAVIAEHFGFIVGYATMAFGGLVFQFMGSISARDPTVVKLTVVGSVHEPILILVSLLFAHLIKSSTNKLDTSPVYRRTMIESRKSSLSDIFANVPSPGGEGIRTRDSNWTLRQGSTSPLPQSSVTVTRAATGSSNSNTLTVPSQYNLGFVPDTDHM